MQLCGEIFNLPLSEGGAVPIVKRAGKAVFGEAETIAEKVRMARWLAVTKPTRACME